MASVRVVIYGFNDMAEFVFSSFIRDLTGVREVEAVYTMDELAALDSSRLVDYLAFTATALGFNLDNQLKRMKLQFPEACLVCISPHRISDFIGMRLFRSGVDILLANIDSHIEFQRAKAAIQGKNRYFPPSVRNIITERTHVYDNGYRFLSHKEHAMLVLTMKGMTLKEIARELNVAETTACTARRHAFRKMGVRSLVDLVRVGYQYNLHHTEKSDYAL
ncbi:MAG TPA: LuxR C-terminal-related transcriptional regulator [Treponemataceae bacterium]|nr:LuxR C-terminal-related transcriptional regulator [Treponemataceae bacterium]